jgi:hypothetical protein
MRSACFPRPPAVAYLFLVTPHFDWRSPPVAVADLILVRSMALWSLCLSVVVCFAARAAHPTASSPPLRIIRQAGDPPLAGEAHLLSDSSFRELLTVVRERATRIDPHFSIREVHVWSATGATVALNVWDGTVPYDLGVEKRASRWHIIQAERGRDPIVHP